MAAEPISPDTARSATWVSVRRSAGETHELTCTASYLLDRPDLAVVHELLPPGAQTRAHAHDRSRQFFHVLRGQATVILGPRTVLVPAGSGLEIAPRERHVLRNDGEDELELLVVSAPRVAGSPHTQRRTQPRERGGLVIGSYVRPTRERDLARVVEMEAAGDNRRWLGQGGAEWHERVLQDADMEHWVLVDRLDRVLAFGVLAGLREPGAVELRRMVVAQEGRGQGLGRVLLRELLEQALARPQVSLVWLDVGDDNVRAQSLYRTFGFQQKQAPAWAELLGNGVYMEWSAHRA